MEETKAQALLKKYIAGNCTEEEKALLETWYLQHDHNNAPAITPDERQDDKDLIFAVLEEATAPAKHMLWPKLIAIAAAAIAIIVVGIGYYSYMRRDTNAELVATKTETDVTPGSNKAVLKLANGQVINLQSDKNGIVIKAGELAYNDGTQINTDAGNENNSASKNNTISTPVGGQYQVILQDGTKVWLNAASSLSYPTTFTGAERKVTVTGEAYFEVAHNKKMPFKVISKGQKVEVLGTHFNVMAYENEPFVKTTLLKGSVRVAPIGLSQTAENDVQNAQLLKPNQQAVFTGSNHITVQQVDVEDAVAWKNGYFKFNEDVKSIMHKIARWYDIEVTYKPGVDLGQTFSGEVSKTRNLSVLLKVMELTGNVHFKVEGRRIIVMP